MDFDFGAFLKAHWVKILAGLVALTFVLQYNGTNGRDQTRKAGWSNVGSYYQRQAELIPNLAEAVKGYAKHESGVFGTVTEMRSKAGQTSIDVSKLAGNPELQQKLAASSADITSTLSKLLVVRESYPDLKADRQFSKLMDELAGSANRIAVARRDAIGNDKAYNTGLGNLPFGWAFQLLGFKTVAYYEAPAGSTTVPQLKF